MRNNILIFIENIRPIENILGLVKMSEVSTLISYITIVGKVDEKYKKYMSGKINFINKIDKKEIKEYNIVFGLPSKFSSIKMMNVFSKKQIFISIGPGKITKAIGLFKHPEKSIKHKIIGYLKYLIPNNYYIAEDFDDAIYLATAYGRDIDFYKPIGLPKKINISLELSKEKTHNKIGILFVPTHRWPGKLSTISEWLGDDKFVNKLENYNLFYNNHPDEKDAKVSDKVIKTREVEESFWKNIDILVTDYSSIAHDFLSAGGKNVINITTDLSEFEVHQGKSPLSNEKQFPGVICNTQEEFIKALDHFNDLEKNTVDLKEFSNQWFKELIEIKKTK